MDDDRKLVNNGFCSCCDVNVKNFDKHINTKSHNKKKKEFITYMNDDKMTTLLSFVNMDFNNPENLKIAIDKVAKLTTNN